MQRARVLELALFISAICEIRSQCGGSMTVTSHQGEDTSLRGGTTQNMMITNAISDPYCVSGLIDSSGKQTAVAGSHWQLRLQHFKVSQLINQLACKLTAASGVRNLEGFKVPLTASLLLMDPSSCSHD